MQTFFHFFCALEVEMLFDLNVSRIDTGVPRAGSENASFGERSNFTQLFSFFSTCQ